MADTPLYPQEAVVLSGVPTNHPLIRLIGILGIAVCMPGQTLAARHLWSHLEAGTCHITASPPVRWKQACQQHNAPAACLSGSFLPQDLESTLIAPFGGFGAAEAKHADIHVQMLADLSFQAVQDGGRTRDAVKSEPICVFTGCGVGGFLLPT